MGLLNLYFLKISMLLFQSFRKLWKQLQTHLLPASVTFYVSIYLYLYLYLYLSICLYFPNVFSQPFNNSSWALFPKQLVSFSSGSPLW